MTESPSSYAQGVATYFHILHAKRQHLNNTLRHVDQYLSTNFNVFDFIAPNENKVSDVLRELLDPNGSHGQGSAFLDAFLERLDVPRDARRNPVVRREARTVRSETSYRRLDLLLDLGTMGIAIETKLGAADQMNQIAAYHEELSRTYGRNYVVVYLTTDGRPPSAFSVGTVPADDRHHQNWSFGGQLIPWLLDCQNLCQSDKFRWFLRDFAEYLRSAWPNTLPEASNER